MTAKDIDAAQSRIPRGVTKTILPPERQDLPVLLRGRELTCRSDPRYGPPERSGVIRVGKTAARGLLRPGDVLNVRAGPRRIGSTEVPAQYGRGGVLPASAYRVRVKSQDVV